MDQEKKHSSLCVHTIAAPERGLRSFFGPLKHDMCLSPPSDCVQIVTVQCVMADIMASKTEIGIFVSFAHLWYTFVIFILNCFPCLCNRVYFIAQRVSAGFLSSNVTLFNHHIKLYGNCLSVSIVTTNI